MQTIELWSVNRNTDGCEGRGAEVPVVYTTSAEVAHDISKDPRFFKRYGVMGCDNCGTSKVVINIVNSMEELAEIDEQAERRTALGKLTARERQLLKL